MTRTLILTLALLCTTSHAALRGGTGPTMPTNPVPITGGGSPTTTCLIYPMSCVQ